MDMNQNRKCALTFESCTLDDSPKCQVAYWFTKKSLIQTLNIFLELAFTNLNMHIPHSKHPPKGHL